VEQPTPDDKNWTWVLERPCPQCGYDVATIKRNQIGARLRANAAAWRGVLRRGEIVSVRPPSDATQGPVWSALEYGAHVRDVFDVFAKRIERMLRDDEPAFPNWDQDRTAIDKQYHLEDPARVTYELAVRAGRLADMIDRVSGDQWQRRGHRSDGSTFTVESLAYYLLHDPVHHLWDAEQGFEAIAGTDGAAGEDDSPDEGDWDGDWPDDR
jgi:hypothetical protein